MDKERLIAALQQIKTLADESLQSIASPRAGPKTRTVLRTVRSSSRNTLSIHVLGLREEGFFKQARTAMDVHAKLQSRYACALNRVAVALLRLQRRKLLRKTAKVIGKRKQTAYVW
jgi:hypothetical protein